MKKHSPEEIGQILRSITRMEMNHGELETWFEDDLHSTGIRSFIPGSFTRQLLEFIEDYLSEE